MRRVIITTGDGSKTIQIVDWDEQYHSKHGAINEAYHVFIDAGLRHFIQENNLDNLKTISILEIGFGTGLNTFITALESEKLKRNIDYVGVEAYPVMKDELEELNFAEQIDKSKSKIFEKIHSVEWEGKSNINKNFLLTKRKQFISEIKDINNYDLIYFDAFGARVQPELWTKEIFNKMYNALRKNGVLVTYAAIGQVKRDLQAIGFYVERLPGPPGKRHMLRATK